MKILKKIQQLKDFSKTFFTKSNKISDSPKVMIDYILSHPDLTTNEHLLIELAQITNNTTHTTQIANILTSKLEKFQYNQPSIQNTFVVLELIIYILKNGNNKFSLDINGHKAILDRLQVVNSRYFQNKFMKNSKELNYTLQMIKQKAHYIKLLLQQPLLLAEEREKMQELRKEKINKKLENLEVSVDCETNINLKKEMSQQPVYVVSNKHRRQGSNKIVQQEVINDIEDNAKTSGPVLSYS